jgi:hypothetical protein
MKDSSFLGFPSHQRKRLRFLTQTDAVTENPQKYLAAERNITNTTGWDPVSKCTKDAENLYAPLVMVSKSIGSRKMALAGNTVYQSGSIDTHLCFH